MIMVTDMAAAAAAGLLLCFSASIELGGKSLAASWKAASARGEKWTRQGDRLSRWSRRDSTTTESYQDRVRRCMIERGGSTVANLVCCITLLTLRRTSNITPALLKLMGVLGGRSCITQAQHTHVQSILSPPISSNRLTCLWCLHF